MSSLRFAPAQDAVLCYGDTRIPYTIRRGPRRRRTVAIIVDLTHGVEVRAPLDTSRERIEELVRRRAAWIAERRRRLDALPPGHGPRELVSGETFRYLGRQYRLAIVRRDEVVEGTDPRPTASDGAVSFPSPSGRGVRGEGVPRDDSPQRVRLVGRHLVIPHPPTAHDPGHVRRALVAWYRAQANRRLPERAALWAARLGLEPTAVLVRDQRKRWGSADTKGVVRLNWRIVQAPMRLVDYVVVHELVHLRYPGHTRRYWAALGEAMPDYEERREALRALGGSLVW